MFLAKLIFMYLRPPLHVERASERQEISVPFAASLGPQITAFEHYFIGNGLALSRPAVFFSRTFNQVV